MSGCLEPSLMFLIAEILLILKTVHDLNTMTPYFPRYRVLRALRVMQAFFKYPLYVPG